MFGAPTVGPPFVHNQQSTFGKSIPFKPGTTVLQVSIHISRMIYKISCKFLILTFSIDDRLQHKLMLRFRVFVIMNDWPLLAIVESVWLKSSKRKKVQKELLPVLCPLRKDAVLK